ICSGLYLLPDLGQHCTTVDRQAMKTASSALRFTIAIRRKGRLSDMLPSISGSLTFICEVTAASASKARAWAGCRAWLGRAAYTALAAAARAMTAIYVFTRWGLGFKILSFP